MPVKVYATNDGWVLNGLDATFVSARSAGTGNANNTDTRHASSVNEFFSGRGGGSWGIYRSFYQFDTSTVTLPPIDAVFRVYGYSGSSADIIAVRSTHSDPLENDDFDALYGASGLLANSDGAGRGKLSTVSGLTYSNAITTWSTSGYNDIGLNATARNDMARFDAFKICIMGYVHDFLDVENSSIFNSGGYYSEYTGISRDPFIDYTRSDSSVFFGTNF